MILSALLKLIRPRRFDDAPFPQLRQGCLEGDEAARRSFIRRFEAVAWRAVRARLPRLSHEDQEEVVADTFIALLRDDAELLRRYDPLKGLSPEGWIRRQALLQASNKARAQGALKRRQEVLAPEGDAVTERTFPDAAPDPERRLIDDEALRALLIQLEDRLSPASRLTFEMLYVRELDAQAAAEALGCTVDSLYTRKRRLLAAVEAILREREEEGEP